MRKKFGVTMRKNKKYMVKCAFCGHNSWQSRFINGHYDLALIDVVSSGKGKIKNVFYDWSSDNVLSSVFQTQFYDVLRYLLRNRFVSAKIVSEIAELYLGNVDVIKPTLVLRPRSVYKPDAVLHPKLVYTFK